MEHRWTDSDNLICFGYYRLGLNEHTYGIEPEELADIMGTTFGSINKKVANFKYLDDKGGMEGYSRQAERIFREYRDYSNEQIRYLGIEAVGKTLERYTNR